MRISISSPTGGRAGELKGAGWTEAVAALRDALEHQNYSGAWERFLPALSISSVGSETPNLLLRHAQSPTSSNWRAGADRDAILKFLTDSQLEAGIFGETPTENEEKTRARRRIDAEFALAELLSLVNQPTRLTDAASAAGRAIEDFALAATELSIPTASDDPSSLSPRADEARRRAGFVLSVVREAILALDEPRQAPFWRGYATVALALSRSITQAPETPPRNIVRMDVLLVPTEASRKGEAATLVIEREEELSCQLDALGIKGLVFNDVYRQGFLLTDEAWEAAWEDAVRCALDWPEGGPLGAVSWRLEFHPKRDSDGKRRHPPIMICGASAGAAMAAMLISLRTGRRLDPYALVSARLVRPLREGAPWRLGYVLGEWGKAVALAEDWHTRHGYRPTLHLAKFSTDKADENASKEREAARQSAERSGLSLIEVDTFSELFDRLTLRREAVEAFFHQTRIVASNRFRFLPLRFESRVHAGDAAALDELNAPIEVAEAEAGRITDLEPDRPDDFRERARDEREPDRWTRERYELADARERPRAKPLGPADEAFNTWLNGAGSKRLFVFGAPGSGKSWLSIRWSIRKAEEFFAHRDPESESDRSPYFPIWTTAKQIHKILKSNEDDLSKALASLVSARVPQEQWKKPAAETLKEAEAAGRILIIVDGWDEVAPGERAVLTEALRPWSETPGHRVVVFSRRHEVADQPLGGGVDYWLLSPLEAASAEEAPALIRRWFGEVGREKFDALWGELSPHPSLVEMVRSPLLAAVVCWLWNSGNLKTLPLNRTKLLLAALEEIVRRCSRAPEEEGIDYECEDTTSHLLEDLLRTLSELAAQTFVAERWSLTYDELRSALKKIDPERDPKKVLDALAGRFGLFAPGPDDRYEIIHQSFAELLVALWVKRELDKLAVSEGVHEWLEDHGGIRLLDPRWLEVWRHLASLLDPQRFDVLLGVLDEIQNRDQPGPKGIHRQPPADAVESSFLAACQCVGARGPKPPTSRSPEVVSSLLDRWSSTPSLWHSPAVHIARAGWRDFFLDKLSGPLAGNAVQVLLDSGKIEPAYAERIAITIAQTGKHWFDPSTIQTPEVFRDAIPALLTELEQDSSEYPPPVVPLLGALARSAQEAIPILINKSYASGAYDHCATLATIANASGNADSILLAFAEHPPDPNARLNAIKAMGHLRPQSAQVRNYLLGSAESKDLQFRLAAIYALSPDDGLSSSETALLCRLLLDDNAWVQIHSARMLRHSPEPFPEVVDSLRKAWDAARTKRDNLSGIVQLTCVESLLHLKYNSEWRDAINDVAASSPFPYSTRALFADDFSSDECVSVVDQKNHGDQAARQVVAWGLPVYAQFDQVDESWIRRHGDDHDPVVRRAIAHSLGRMGQLSAASLSFLQELLTDDDPLVKCAAARALIEREQRMELVLESLLACTNDRNGDVVLRSVQLISKMGSFARGAISRLLELLHLEWTAQWPFEASSLGAELIVAIAAIEDNQTSTMQSLADWYLKHHDSARHIREGLQVIERLKSFGMEGVRVMRSRGMLSKMSFWYVKDIARAASVMIPADESLEVNRFPDDPIATIL